MVVVRSSGQEVVPVREVSDVVPVWSAPIPPHSFLDPGVIEGSDYRYDLYDYKKRFYLVSTLGKESIHIDCKTISIFRFSAIRITSFSTAIQMQVLTELNRLIDSPHPLFEGGSFGFIVIAIASCIF